MVSQLRLILDDDAGDIVYTGGAWTVSTLVQWYSRTSNYPAFASLAGSGNSFGSLSLAFEGTQVVFIGNTPTSDFSQFALVTIDGGSAINTTYGNIEPPAYIQWYQSPVLSDGQHTIKIDNLDGTAVDMAIITVGPNTPLANKKVFVDDLDSAIQYSGSWVQDTSGFNAGTLPDGFPIGLTTHRSSTVGDSLTFRFTGTSVALYGIFSWTNLGLLSATYTLDGNALAQSYPVIASSAEHVSADGEASNFIFYSNDTIPAGDHTLVMQITQANGITFVLDYITYSPSFATPADMPNLAATSSSAAPLSATSGFSSALSSTLPPASTASGALSSQTASTSSKAPIGAIVGGVVGGLAVVVLAIFCLFWLRKTRPVEEESVTVEPFERSPEDSHRNENISSTWRSNQSSSSLTPYTGFSSMTDIKRGRGPGAQAPMSEARSSTNDRPSFSATQPGGRVMSTTSTGLEYVSGPPAYDALSATGHEQRQ